MVSWPLKIPTAKDLDSWAEKKHFRGLVGVGLLSAYKGQFNFRVTYCLGWFFSGGSVGGEGSWLVQNCLGEGGAVKRLEMGVPRRTPGSAGSVNCGIECLFPYFLTRAPWLALSPTFDARVFTSQVTGMKRDSCWSQACEKIQLPLLCPFPYLSLT